MNLRSVDLQAINAHAINTLVFEGCGSRFLTYIYALDAISKQMNLQKIDRVAASSSGAIVATLLAVGFSPKEMSAIFENVELVQLLNPTKTSRYLPYIGYFMSVIAHRGAYTGETCRAFFKNKLNEKGLDGDLTFQGLHELKLEKKLPIADLYLTAANVTRNGELQVFSHLTTPHVPIADALIAAIAYPGYIQPHSILMNSKIEKFVDGGIRDNLPFNIFPLDEWSQILGLKVDTKAEIFGHCYKEPNISEFLYELIHDAEFDYKKFHRKRTIQFYDGNVSVLEAQLTPLTKLAFKISGKEAVNDYFKNIEKSQEQKRETSFPDNLALRQRTLNFINKINEHVVNKELITEINAWNDNKQGCFIHYHVVLDHLRSQSGYLYNNKNYKELYELIKKRSIATSLYADASSEHVTDVIMEFLQSNQGNQAFFYLKECCEYPDPRAHPKLLDIDHDAILAYLATNKIFCTHPFKYKNQFIELLESLKERKLKCHPGAAEAEYIIKIDHALTAKAYEVALTLLKQASQYLTDADSKELYFSTQQQLLLAKDCDFPALLLFLQKQTETNSIGFFKKVQSEIGAQKQDGVIIRSVAMS